MIATSEKKIVILIGMAGIGKSSLVRNAINYLSERKQFLSGIVFVQAKGVESTEILLKIIIGAFML